MSDLESLTSSSEPQKIKREKTILTSDYYQSPQTSLLIFKFEPNDFKSSSDRIKACSINHASIENKDFYIFDEFFQKKSRANSETSLATLHTVEVVMEQLKA